MSKLNQDYRQAPLIGRYFLAGSLFMLLCTQGLAQIYKYEDEQGNIIYSDSPPEEEPGLEPADLPEIILQPSVEVPENIPQAAPGPEEIEISIHAPVNEEIIPNHQMHIVIRANASRALGQGEKASLIVNGQEYATSRSIHNWQITDLVRGEYSIQIQVVYEGAVIGQSETVVVYVQRNTIGSS